MTIAEQSKVILAALKGWVANNKGRSFIAADALDVVQDKELRAKPGTPTAAVLWMSEDPHGNYPELGKVLRGFKIVITRGRGLKLLTGESLTEGVAGGEPLFNLVEQAREVARSLRMTDQEGELQIPVYQGTSQFEVQGYILDAYEIRFGLFATLPDQSETEAQAAPDNNPTSNNE